MTQTSPTPSRIGQLIAGRYRVLGPLGQGAFAQVYRGEDIILERQVAIKLMNLGVLAQNACEADATTREMTGRFLNEARLVAQLKDNATVTLFDFGSEPHGELYMILELVSGSTLRERVERRGPLDAEQTAKVLQRLLESLREAHSLGMLHRDVKPENIMIFELFGDSCCVRLVDFGIAKALEGKMQAMTAAGILVGTPRYVSPERILQRELIPASDLYSLGATAVFMLTGQDIYPETRGIGELVQRQMEPTSATIPPEVRVPARLRAVVNKLLQKPLEARYPSAQQVLDDLALLNLELAAAHYTLTLEDVRAASDTTQALPSVTAVDPSNAATQHIAFTPNQVAPPRVDPLNSRTPAPQLQTAPPGTLQASSGDKQPPWLIIGLIAITAAVLLVIIVIIIAILFTQ